MVVEMFLSQACSDSPPAAEFQAELSRRPDLVAITWHIDYWNILSNRKHGRWEDPFSASEFAARQRIYNRNIRDRSTVFTPQAIVNGAASEIGSKRRVVESFIDLEGAEPRSVRTSVRRVGDAIEATVDPSGNDLRDVLLVRFRQIVSTRIAAGDNFGLTFEERNVAREVSKLGQVRHAKEVFTFAAPPPDQGCAILVQETNQGRIVGARYCPPAE